MRRSLVSAPCSRRSRLALVWVVPLLVVVGCRTETVDPAYCELVTDASGAQASVTTGGRTSLERRRAAAPPAIAEEWATVIAGGSTESNASEGRRRQDAYEAAIASIEAFDEVHCPFR